MIRPLLNFGFVKNWETPVYLSVTKQAKLPVSLTLSKNVKTLIPSIANLIVIENNEVDVDIYDNLLTIFSLLKRMKDPALQVFVGNIQPSVEKKNRENILYIFRKYLHQNPEKYQGQITRKESLLESYKILEFFVNRNDRCTLEDECFVDKQLVRLGLFAPYSCYRTMVLFSTIKSL